MDVDTAQLAWLHNLGVAALNFLAQGNIPKAIEKVTKYTANVPRVDFMLSMPGTWSGGSGPMAISLAAMEDDGLTINPSYVGSARVTCDPISTGPVPVTLYNAAGQVVSGEIATGFVNGRWNGRITLHPNIIGIYPPVELIRVRDLSVDLAGEGKVQWVL